MKLIYNNKRLAMPIMTHPGIELIGKSVKEAVSDGAIHADAIVALSEATPSDAATAIMDLTVEAEAFGAKIVMHDNDVPTVSERMLHNKADVEALKVPALDSGRVGQYLKANELASKKITDKPVLAGCIGSYSLAGLLYDMSEFMMDLYIEPTMANKLLEKCNEFLTEYVKALKATGVDGVVIAEPAAGLLSNEDATAYSTNFIKRIVRDVQDSDFTVILHNCGNRGHCTRSMLESEALALHFGNQCDIVQALKEVPSDIAVMGNIDPVGVMLRMHPDQIYEETSKLLHATEAYQNFILSTGCDVPPGVPMPNIAAFYQALADYNRQ